MNKVDIANLLNKNVQNLTAFFENERPEKWTQNLEGKWTPGQHVIHLIQSADAIRKGLRFPSFILKWNFGKANRPVRSYEEVVHNYVTKLAKVGPVVAGVSANMPTSNIDNKPERIKEFIKLYYGLNKKLLSYSDQQLDSILLPHPLMGRMILREFFMWNAHHVGHHYELLLEKYKD